MTMDSPDFKELLHTRDLKATNTRIQLLIAMETYGSAIPYSAIQDAMKPIDRVTLYRTLESLKEKGIIHIAFQGKHETYYAICSTACDKESHDHDHVHFKCVQCKSVTCEKPKGSVKISIPYTDIHKISIHVEGRCGRCKDKAEADHL